MFKLVLSCAWCAFSIVLAPALSPTASSTPVEPPRPLGCEFCTDKGQAEPAGPGASQCAIFTFQLLQATRGTCDEDVEGCKAELPCAFDYVVSLQPVDKTCCTSYNHTIENGTVSPPGDETSWTPPSLPIPTTPFPPTTVPNHQIPCTQALRIMFWGECHENGQTSWKNLGGFSLTCSYCK